MLAEQLGRNSKVALFSMDYKTNVADLGKSPAIEIACALHHFGHSVIFVEPHAQSFDDLILFSADDTCRITYLRVIIV